MTTTTRKNSRGRALLIEALQNTTEAKIAEKLGLTIAAVSSYVCGLCAPSYRPRIILEREYNIGGHLWDEPV